MDVAVTFSRFSEDQRERLRAAAWPDRLLEAGYADSHAARNAKAAGAPASEVRSLESVSSPELTSMIARAEVILALDLPLDVLTIAPQVRWVQAYGAGVGQLLRVLAGRPVQVTTAAGASAPSIAEFVIGRLIQVVRRFRDLDDRQADHAWVSLRTPSVSGTHLVVVGFGHIGAKVTDLALALGMSVTAVRRTDRSDVPDGVRAVPRERLLEILPSADAVVVCAPETPETTGARRVITEREVAAMRPNAVLINVARGSLVDEIAVAEALHAGRLGAAVLDVTEVEPLPSDSPLWDAPNMYLSPHSSSSNEGHDEALLDLFLDNLARYRAGRSLRNLVNPDLGY